MSDEDRVLLDVASDAFVEAQAEIKLLRQALQEACAWAVSGNFPPETDINEFRERILKDVDGE